MGKSFHYDRWNLQMKKVLVIILALCLMLSLAACSAPPADDDTENATNSTEAPSTEAYSQNEITETTEVPTTELPESAEESFSESETIFTLEDLAILLEGALSNNSSGIIYTTEYTDTSISLNCTIEGLDEAVETIMNAYGENEESWLQLRDTSLSTDIYSSIVSLVDTYNLGKVDIIQNLVGYEDSTTIYATYTNGQLSYDIMHEISATSTTWYPESMYKVGVDIPAGEYYVVGTNTFAAYICVSSDSNGEDILMNDNFNGQYYVELEDGQYFEVNRAKFASVAEVVAEVDCNHLEEGMYKVGIDIPAGEYKLECASDFSAYVCVYDNSSSNRDILTNDNFDGVKYVTVQEGQYLLINRCVGSYVG